ncbi:MAG: hypothetical protein S4CHLAM102_07110 [Chlamydiia bacterium]|nr:hypothetical protein [Chlamydiia bacterium]
MQDKVTFKILRGLPGAQYWETFEIELEEGANVISSLMKIRRSPVNQKGEKTTPVIWEDGCLEEVCGSCSMLINGIPRQACSTIIKPLIEETGSSTISLAPLTKFSLIRDLQVDRQAMFDSLKKIRGWVDITSSRTDGPGPRVSPDEQEVAYSLSTCMTCGCCMEACPQFNENSSFIGPAPISQVRYFGIHPTSRLGQPARIRVMLEKGGIAECGNAQACVAVCPKNIPLTESIAGVGREATQAYFWNLFGAREKKK